MRNVRAVYQKLREVKYHHLVKLYKKYTRKIPENCKYNYPYKITSETGASVEIRLCLLHQPEIDLKSGIFPHLVDICQEQEHCTNCNAFVNRYTKEEMKKLLEAELNGPRTKELLYPDICALEWVMEQSEGIPGFRWIEKMLYSIKKWFRKGRK